MTTNTATPTTSAIELSYTPVPATNSSASVAVVTLNRPEAANAFSGDMIEQLTKAFKAVGKQPDCRALILRGRGKNFSAGADLKWMQQAAALDYRANFGEARVLSQMFDTLYELPLPTIAVTHGAVFGGAVGLTACCDISIALDGTKFCLSEVKLGLLPAVILPYLGRRMQVGALRRYSLTGRVFTADEAKTAGLVDTVCKPRDLQSVLREELNLLLAAGPQAQRELKALHRDLMTHQLQQMERTAATIAKARTGDEGQAGLKAFFAQQTPPWTMTLPKDWSAYHET